MVGQQADQTRNVLEKLLIAKPKHDPLVSAGRESRQRVIQFLHATTTVCLCGAKPLMHKELGITRNTVGGMNENGAGDSLAQAAATQRLIVGMRHYDADRRKVG